MTLMDFTAGLQGRRKQTPKPGINEALSARCPAHDDQNPSLVVWESADGWKHVRCRAGCSEDAILAAMGRTHDDRRAKAIEHRDGLETEYLYADACGVGRFSKVRFYVGGRKSFRIEGDVCPIPYRLPEVVSTARQGGTVYVNEGEKAVEMCRSKGLTATCAYRGAGSPWRDEEARYLAGADVVFVRDVQDSTDEWVRQSVRAIAAHAKSVRVVQSATGGEKHDAFDHFAAGHTVEEFVPCPGFEPPEPGFQAVALADVDAMDELPHLFGRNVFPVGYVSMLDGDGGSGKTSLALAAASALSQGGSLGRHKANRTGLTLFFHSEDGGGPLKTVLTAQPGADPTRVFLVEEPFQLDAPGVRDVRATVESLEKRTGQKVLMVVFDAVTYYLPHGCEINSASDVAPVMKRLQALARELQTAVVLVRHTPKATKDRPRALDGIGSAMFRNMSRQAVVVSRDRETGVCSADFGRGNILHEEAASILFRRVGPRVEFLHPPEDRFDGPAPWTGD